MTQTSKPAAPRVGRAGFDGHVHLAATRQGVVAIADCGARVSTLKSALASISMVTCPTCRMLRSPR
jgi:hypothetical protein